MNVKFVLLIFALVFCLCSRSLVLANPQETLAAFQYLNKIRVAAGLAPFMENEILNRSSLNHAKYLTYNRIVGHLQKPGWTFFTGIKPGDRALYQGYEIQDVTENFSSGQLSSIESIDGLMSAIYHRFGFLDFSKDEIGIALVEMTNGYNFVYNMGNSQLNRFCQFAIDTRDGPYYKDICKQSVKVSAQKLDQLERQIRLDNPSIVVWPPENGVNIPPVFYEEIPDPLPNLSVSGYPVSIQFNSAYYAKIRLLDFRLYEISDFNEVLVNPVHLMTSTNDPNQNFTENQFALFPLKRLKWNTKYRATVSYQQNGNSRTKSWSFTTRGVPYPMFEIKGYGDSLDIEENKRYAVYLPPNHRAPFIERLRWSAPSTVQVDVTWEDKNTLLVSLSGEKCQKVLFSSKGQNTFSIQLADNANLNKNNHYPKTNALSCLMSTVKDMQGFRISGRGELLKLQSGKQYWVEIDSKRNITSAIQMQYAQRMKIDIKHLSENVIKLIVVGTPGQSAEFFLGNNKTFKAIIVNR